MLTQEVKQHGVEQAVFVTYTLTHVMYYLIAQVDAVPNKSALSWLAKPVTSAYK